MLACVDGKLAETKIEWSDEAAVSVVMASGGYPGDYEKGKVIQGIKEAEATGTLVFHAGTAEKDGGVVTAGGRVLNVVGVAKDIRTAVDKAYAGVEKISFEGVHYRKDIAHRALERLK
jgi:phosphoribosylamine--glycine ligase